MYGGYTKLKGTHYTLGRLSLNGTALGFLVENVSQLAVKEDLCTDKLTPQADSRLCFIQPKKR